MGTLVVSQRHPTRHGVRIIDNHMIRLHLTVLILAWTVLAAGCGSYAVRGKVIEGFDSGVLIVSADDPRLDEPGVRQVRVMVHRDPDSLAQKVVASGTSDSDGFFNIELREFGAGWMDEYWLIETSRSNYSNVVETIRLPANSNRSRLLIIVAPGTQLPSEYRDELWEDYRRYR